MVSWLRLVLLVKKQRRVGFMGEAGYPRELVGKAPRHEGSAVLCVQTNVCHCPIHRCLCSKTLILRTSAILNLYVHLGDLDLQAKIVQPFDVGSNACRVGRSADADMHLQAY